MVASQDTVVAIYRAVRNHVTDEQMEKIINDLLQVQGNQSFRHTIIRLAALDAATAQRKRNQS
jgi:hypothetical protein